MILNIEAQETFSPPVTLLLGRHELLKGIVDILLRKPPPRRLAASGALLALPAATLFALLGGFLAALVGVLLVGPALRLLQAQRTLAVELVELLQVIPPRRARAVHVDVGDQELLSLRNVLHGDHLQPAVPGVDLAVRRAGVVEERGRDVHFAADALERLFIFFP